MNKMGLIMIIIGIIVIVVVAIKLFGGEDDWIRNDNGLWVAHGNPANTPSNVKEQWEAVACGIGLYAQEKINGDPLNSQCLGSCGDYAIDIVHVPRVEFDDLNSSQCTDFLNGNLKKFIEIDKDGNIVRVSD